MGPKVIISAIEQIYKTHEFIITLKKLKFHTLNTTVTRYQLLKRKEFCISPVFPVWTVFHSNQIALVYKEKLFTE